MGAVSGQWWRDTDTHRRRERGRGRKLIVALPRLTGHRRSGQQSMSAVYWTPEVRAARCGRGLASILIQLKSHRVLFLKAFMNDEKKKMATNYLDY